MRLILLQHGDAVPGESDAHKYLSVKGNEQAARAAEFISRLPFGITSIIHSGKLRAVQTAGIVAERLGGIPLEQRDGIGPKDPVQPLIEYIASCSRPLLVVGHFPFLRVLAAALLSLPGERVPFDFTNCSPLVLKQGNDSWLLELYAKNDLLP